MSEERTCHIHGTKVPGFCPTCIEEHGRLPDPETMTGEEREREMDRIAGPMEVPFDLVHARIEALVGRPVWTHEMTSSNWPSLVAEAGNRTHPRFETILNLIPEEKRIVVAIDGTREEEG